MATNLDTAIADLTSLTKSERTVAFRDAVSSLPSDQKKELEQVLKVMVGTPDQTTSNRVWLIVIWTFALVLFGAVSVLCVGYFVPPVAAGTKPETIFAVFTTVSAFLAGLFAPSPVAEKSGE